MENKPCIKSKNKTAITDIQPTLEGKSNLHVSSCKQTMGF